MHAKTNHIQAKTNPIQTKTNPIQTKTNPHCNKNKFPRELLLFNLLHRHMQSPWSHRSFNFAIKLHNRVLQCQSAECGDCFLCACDMCCFPCARDMSSLYLRRAVPMRTQAHGSIAMRRGGSALCPPCCTPPQRYSLFCRGMRAQKLAPRCSKTSSATAPSTPFEIPNNAQFMKQTVRGNCRRGAVGA